METEIKEQLKPQKMKLEEINAGNKYKNGDIIHADAINRTVESAIYTQNKVENLCKTPDYSEANSVGVPQVSIGASGNLKFKNLKGQDGAANNLTIGTVTKGVDAAATITGESPNQSLNLVLPKGDRGSIFTPVVSSEGVISWSNPDGVANPVPINIRGPQGLKGADGSLFYVNNQFKSTYNVNRLSIRANTVIGENWSYKAPYFVFQYLMPPHVRNINSKYFVVHPDDKVTALALKSNLALPYVEYDSSGYIRMYFNNMDFGNLSMLIDVLER